MKTRNMIVALWVCLVVALSAIEPTWSPDDREWESEQVALWEDNISKAAALPASEKFEALALGLRNMGGRASVSGHSPSVDHIYQKLQREFLSIPGHATYYRDKIKAAQAAVREGKMTWNAWDRLRLDATQTLQHMPSEEAVEVLADFLGDNFACSDSDNPADYEIEGLANLIREWDMSIREPAKRAIVNIGIENPPNATETHISGGALRNAWLQWWQEVKAGKRKYRFKGSNVEHPINAPPGTMREVRRPGREPDATTATKAAEKPVPRSPKNEKAKSRSPQWPVFAGIAALLAALATYLLRRNGKAVRIERPDGGDH